MDGFITLADGRSITYKDPDARKPYGIDLTDVLAREATTVKEFSVEEVVGVEITNQAGTADGGAFQQGSVIAAWVKGSPGHVTLRYELNNGILEFKTLYFRTREN